MPLAGQLVDWLQLRAGVDAIVGSTGGVPNPPNQLVTGCVARSRQDAVNFTPGIVHNTVIQYGWNKLQPTSLSALSTGVAGNGNGSLNGSTATGMTALVQDMDWAYSQGYKVRLRILAGPNSPSDLLTGSNVLTTWWDNTSTPTWVNIGPVPMWWLSGYLAAYGDFHTRLAAAAITSTTGATVFAQHPALAEVCMFCTATNTGEPFIKKVSYLANRQILYNLTGSQAFSNALDWTAMEAGSTVHQNIWSPQGIATYFPFNPYQTVNPPKSGGTTPTTNTSTPDTIAVMNDFMGKVQRCGVVGNNSLLNPVDPSAGLGSFYQQMYDQMETLRARSHPWPVPIGFQSATDSKIESLYGNSSSPSYQVCTIGATIAMAIGWGATCVEIPAGCDTAPSPFTLTPSAAAGYNSSFDANAATLLA
jgi:hypothetical protein